MGAVREVQGLVGAGPVCWLLGDGAGCWLWGRHGFWGLAGRLSLSYPVRFVGQTRTPLDSKHQEPPAPPAFTVHC